MLNNTYFLTGLSFLLLHEMDAVRCREWRIFPGLSMLSEESGKRVFLFSHVPLFYILLQQLVNKANPTDFATALSIFMIVHAVLHLLFLLHKRNEFTDWISWTFISGAGIFGFLHLILERNIHLDI